MAGDVSRKNGKKGGRPPSQAYIRAQVAREYISVQVQNSLTPIVARAISEAIQGDRYAREWLSAYAWGKPKQEISLGEAEPPIDHETLEKAKKAIGELVAEEDA